MASVLFLVLGLRGAAAPTPKSHGTYEVSGNLDEHNGRCTGRVHLEPDEQGPHCVHVVLDERTCHTNTRDDVDWLFSDGVHGNSAPVCYAGERWQVTSDGLPGRSACRTARAKSGSDGSLESLSLRCTWQCRSGQEPCAGSGTYELRFGASGR